MNCSNGCTDVFMERKGRSRRCRTTGHLCPKLCLPVRVERAERRKIQQTQPPLYTFNVVNNPGQCDLFAPGWAAAGSP
jgi:hypothetical protein